MAYSTGDAGISGATSATTPLKICAAELDACSSERECRSCLKIDASATCKRDTLVDSSHCDGVSEVVCCILENDAGCAANAKLRAAIGTLRFCSLAVIARGLSMRRVTFSDANSVGTRVTQTSCVVVFLQHGPCAACS